MGPSLDRLARMTVKSPGAVERILGGDGAGTEKARRPIGARSCGKSTPGA
jgi:hypothetical protein